MDGPLPVGDLVYVAGIGACVIIDGIMYFSKGGKQRIRDTGLSNLSDEEVTRKSKDSTLSKKERERYKKEDKARKQRNKQKRQGK